MLTIDYDMFFAFKCTLYKSPMFTQLILTGTVSVAFAFIFQVLEGYIPDKQKPINFNDAIWMVFIIITTVGFGDIYAVTNLGRVSNIITSLCGIFMVSLIIMSFEKKLRLTEYELKAYDLVNRLHSKEENNSLIAKYTNIGLKYIIAKKKYLAMIKLRNKNSISKSKLQSEKSNLKYLLYEKISMRDQLKRSLRIFYNNFEPYNVGENMKKRIKEINEHFAMFRQREEKLQQNLQSLLDFFEVIEQVSEFSDNFKMKNVNNNLNLDNISKKEIDSFNDFSTDFFKPSENFDEFIKFKKTKFKGIPEEEVENTNYINQTTDFKQDYLNKSESEYSILEKDLETPVNK
jgi:hypothetical protein